MKLKQNVSFDTINGKPKKVDKIGSNTVVRFNIEEVFEDDVLVGYKAYEIKVDDLDKESIKRAVVADLCDKSELEIFNNFQSYNLGISDNKEYLEDYKKYLTLLNEIDKMIDDETNKEKYN